MRRAPAPIAELHGGPRSGRGRHHRLSRRPASRPTRASSARRSSLPAATEWKLWPVHRHGQRLHRQQRAQVPAAGRGLRDATRTIIEALQTQPNVAVIDSFAIPQGGLRRRQRLRLRADRPDAATTTSSRRSRSSWPRQDGSVSNGDDHRHHRRARSAACTASTRTRRRSTPIYPTLTSTSYYVALNDADRSDAVAKEIEAALLQHGVQATSIQRSS